MPGRRIIVSPQGGGLQILTRGLPNATQNVTYSQQLVAVGNVGATTWILLGSTGTNVWTISPSGQVGGTPTTVESIDTITVGVNDTLNNFATVTITINVVSGYVPVSITSPNQLPNGTQNVAYNYQMLGANGNPGSYVWSELSHTGSNTYACSASGLITGTPSVADSDQVTIKLTDGISSAQGTFNVTVQALAATPTFSPVAGTYTSAQSVTISCSTPSSSIFYTLDGSTPTISSTPYVSPISVSASETIKAIATAAGFSQSAVGSAAYVINTAAPATGLVKFSPGFYMLGENYNATSGTNQTDMNLLTTGNATAVGCRGYMVRYTWQAMETTQGSYAAAAAIVQADAAYLWSKNPLAKIAFGIASDISTSNIFTGQIPTHIFNPNSGPAPGWIMNAPSGVVNVYNTPSYPTSSGATTAYQMSAQANGQYGFGYSAYVNVNNNDPTQSFYIVCITALWDPGVLKARQNFNAMFAQIPLVWSVASGGDGNTYTLDKHPMVESFADVNEVSYSFHSGPYLPTHTTPDPSTGSNLCSNTNFWNNYQAMLTSMSAAWPHTINPYNVTYQVTGSDGSQDAGSAYNTVNGYLSASSLGGIIGTALMPSDTWGANWTRHYNSNLGAQAQNSTQALIGIQNPTGESNVAIEFPPANAPATHVARMSSVQNPDAKQRMMATATGTPVWNNTSADSDACINQILTAALGSPPVGAGLDSRYTMSPSHMWFNPVMADNFNYADWGNHIQGNFSTTALTVNTVRPVNLMTGLTINSVAVASSSSFLISFPLLSLDPAETGLTGTLYENGISIATGINITSGAGTFTRTGRSTATPYSYTLAMANSNGTGPQGPPMVGEIAGQVFNFTSFAALDPNFNTASNNPPSIVLPGSVIALNSTGGSNPNHQATGAWYKIAQVNIQSFTTNFTFQMPAPTTAANGGFSFVIQNSTAVTQQGTFGGFGVNQQGDANCSGYGGLAHLPLNPPNSQGPTLNSVALTFEWYTTQGTDAPFGTPPNFFAFYVNGGPDINQIPHLDLRPCNIALHNGNVMACTLVYDGTILTMTLVDTVTLASVRYSWPINIPACTQQNTAWLGFGAGSLAGVALNIKSWNYSLGFNTRLAAPTFNVVAGHYTSTQIVTISGPAGASIYYSTNGLQPTSSSTLYTGPVTVSASTYLQAVATQSNFTDSPVTSANYVIQASGPTINFPSGFASASNLIKNVGVANLSGSAFNLTDALGGGGEAGGIWYVAPVACSSFSMSTQIQTNGSTAGMAIVFQNQNQSASTGYTPAAPGSAPLGYGSGQLAVTGGPLAIAQTNNGLGVGTSQAPNNNGNGNGNIGLYNSVALALAVSNNQVGVYLNGVLPSGSSIGVTGANLSSAHPQTIALTYSGTTLGVTITDTVTLGVFNHNFTVDIPGTVGASTCWVGITAGNFNNGVQAVNNWTGF